jgi:hypothetical protein
MPVVVGASVVVIPPVVGSADVLVPSWVSVTTAMLLFEQAIASHERTKVEVTRGEGFTVADCTLARAPRP